MAHLFKSIHIRIIFWALIPIFFVMGIITLLSFVTIRNTALEVVQKRDGELAEIAARRLSENLYKYPFFLQNLAASDPMQTMQFSHMDRTVSQTRNWLHFFDGGIYLYTPEGLPVWSYPAKTPYSALPFLDSNGLEQIKTSLRPYFSDIISPNDLNIHTTLPSSPASPLSQMIQNDIIVIGVPVIDSTNECIGVVAGICSVNYSTLGTTYTRILEYKSGRRSYAYLVDGQGKVLYHRHSSLIGNLMNQDTAIQRLLQGETGATVSQNMTGEMVIAGFAPVPGTNWGIVTQGNWSMIEDLIEFYTSLFLAVLWGGGTLSMLLLFIFMQKVLEPIRELTTGAEKIANGHFVEIPVKKTGDEIEIFSRQFNSMARALKASFANINNRITQLNTAQKALKQSEEKISGIINAVNDAMLMIDTGGDILWVNDKGREIFGESPEGNRYHEVIYQLAAPPEDCIVQRCFQENIEDDTEIKINVHGKQLDYWCTCNVVQRNIHRNPTRVVVVCRNLTEKKRLRAEVLRNAQLAALGELAAGIAHEINNPINGIINYAQIIVDSQGETRDPFAALMENPEPSQMPRPSPPKTELPAKIIKEGERIALIVSKLLSFARAGSEKKEPVIIYEVMADVLDLTHAMLRKDHIRVEMDIPPTLPPCRAVIHQVQQIFLNIIGNARYALNQKFQGKDPQKKIIITCSVVDGGDDDERDNGNGNGNGSEKGDGEMIRTCVKDNGVGIPANIINKVCNPFFSTKPADQGTGLGLSISFGIIEEHDGTFEIRSVEGEGTEVMIDLPIWRG